MNWPVREKSANGVPAPKTSIERRCVCCGASFLSCQGGTSGEVGSWRDWQWFCSRECFERPARRPEPEPSDALTRVLMAAGDVWGQDRVADVAARMAKVRSGDTAQRFEATRCGGSPQHYTGECDCP